jgi:hypothetical protein
MEVVTLRTVIEVGDPSSSGRPSRDQAAMDERDGLLHQGYAVGSIGESKWNG